MEQVNQIRRELREFDLASSQCPVDKRRREKQAEEQARKAHEAEAQQRVVNWEAAIDRRIDQFLVRWWGNGEDGAWRDKLFEAVGEAMAIFVGEKLQEERRAVDKKLKLLLDECVKTIGAALATMQARETDGALLGDTVKMLADEWRAQREKLQAAIDEERQAVDAKLAEVEQCLWQLATGPASHQGEIATHDDEAKRGVMIRAIDEVRAETRKWVVEQIEAERLSFEARLVALEDRLKSVPGKLPVAKTWREQSVTYQAEFISHNGALYQARKDTATEPGGSDWVCVARAGHDAITPTLCGNYDAHESYAPLDIVALDGSAWICRRANPGLPGHGDGWQLMSQRGKQGRRGESITGPRGEKGDQGARGEPGRTIVSFKIDDARYRAIAFYENGEPGPELNLRPMYERYFSETGGSSTSDG